MLMLLPIVDTVFFPSKPVRNGRVSIYTTYYVSALCPNFLYNPLRNEGFAGM